MIRSTARTPARLSPLSAVPIGVIAAVLLASISGCTKDDSPPKDALSTSVPQAFNPCKDVTASILAKNQLMTGPISQPKHNESGTPGDNVVAQGCQYLPTETSTIGGSGINVQTTNMTVDYYRDKYWPTHYSDKSLYKEFNIDGRAVATQGGGSSTNCTLLMNIKGGALMLDTANDKTDPCRVLTTFAADVAPLLPAG